MPPTKPKAADTALRCSCCNRRIAYCQCEDDMPKRILKTNDDRLRAVGCTIHARPKKGPDLWRLPDGRLRSTDDALFEMVDAPIALKQQSDHDNVSTP